MPDLFISYSSLDRESIRPIVAAFEAIGLEVWWDQFIVEQRWSDHIEEAIAASRRVLAFISRNVNASPRYYVQAEMQRAQAARKLIPVKVGEFTMSLFIEGITLGEQTLYADDFNNFLTGAGFSTVCRLFGRHTQVEMPDRKASVEEWFAGGLTEEQMALAASIAVAESASLSAVMDLSKDLSRRLGAMMAALDTEAKGPKPISSILQSRTKRLQGVQAKLFSERHRRFGVDYECVRFEEPNRAQEVLGYLWDECDGIHPALFAWLDHLTHTANPDVRKRAALMLGVLARSRFASVFDTLFARWIMDDHPATRDVADMALAVTALEDSYKSTISEIVRDLSLSRNKTRLRAAVELACGYTGARIKGLAIKTLKTVARSDHTDFEVLEVMRNCIEFTLRESLGSDDSSLLDITQLVSDLSEWARAPDDETPSLLPIYLFLGFMSGLPVRPPHDGEGMLSLETITETEETCVPAALVFEAALRRVGDVETFSPTKVAVGILAKWIAEDEGDDPDPLLDFAAHVYAACKSDRDKRRLAYALRQRYSPEELVSQADGIRTRLAIGGQRPNGRSESTLA